MCGTWCLQLLPNQWNLRPRKFQILREDKTTLQERLLLLPLVSWNLTHLGVLQDMHCAPCRWENRTKYLLSYMNSIVQLFSLQNILSTHCVSVLMPMCPVGKALEASASNYPVTMILASAVLTNKALSF